MPDHAPINVTAYDTSSTSINVTWQPIPPDHVNGILQGYHVIYRRINNFGDNISMVTVNNTVLHTELTGLGKYKLYSIQVAGRTLVGLGNFSDPVNVRTDQDGTYFPSCKGIILYLFMLHTHPFFSPSKFIFYIIIFHWTEIIKLLGKWPVPVDARVCLSRLSHILDVYS